MCLERNSIVQSTLSTTEFKKIDFFWSATQAPVLLYFFLQVNQPEPVVELSLCFCFVRFHLVRTFKNFFWIKLKGAMEEAAKSPPPVCAVIPPLLTEVPDTSLQRNTGPRNYSVHLLSAPSWHSHVRLVVSVLTPPRSAPDCREEKWKTCHA